MLGCMVTEYMVSIYMYNVCGYTGFVNKVKIRSQRDRLIEIDKRFKLIIDYITHTDIAISVHGLGIHDEQGDCKSRIRVTKLLVRKAILNYSTSVTH